MKNDIPIFLPYPQTPDSAHAYIRANGLCVAVMARRMRTSRHIFFDLLRGQLKGKRGEAHRVAIALGLKQRPSELIH